MTLGSYMTNGWFEYVRVDPVFLILCVIHGLEQLGTPFPSHPAMTSEQDPIGSHSATITFSPAPQHCGVRAE